MHGLIFSELEKFVTHAGGAAEWQRVLAHSKMTATVFMAVGTYPDTDLLKLVQGTAAVTKKPVAQVLEGFGEFITPTLLNMYRTLIAPGWRTLDLVANTEHVIHTVVRSRGGSPPVLSAQRQDPTHLVVTYGSQRKLCSLARGIIRGIAHHYREDVSVTETACMLVGAKACRMELTLVAASAIQRA